MATNQGASVGDWYLADYPGYGAAGGGGTPQALDSKIQALINGGSLAAGDFLARMSDVTAAINGLKSNPSATNLTLMNGFTGTISVKTTALFLWLQIEMVGPATAPAADTKICDLPANVHAQVPYNYRLAAGASGYSIYASGAALYAGTLGANANIGSTAILMRF